MKMNKTTLAMMVAGCFGASLAMAEEESKILSPVVVTATRVEQDSFDLPMSIDRVEKENIQDAQARVSLAESLVRVPGVTAQYRNQNSSDLTISSRGFGARSTFGVRGVRLYVDGIPLTMPDGIGTPGNVDLGSIGAIEVMRGPFSAMYGSSSGGVIQLFTDTPPANPQIGADYFTGSFGSQRSEVNAAGTDGNINYLLSVSDSSSNGYREHSAWQKQQATARLGVKISEDSKLTTIMSWFQQDAQDPGGLRRSGISVTSGGVTVITPGALDKNGNFYNPRGAYTRAIDFNTGGNKSNAQIGFNYEKSIDANNQLNLITYAGNRVTNGYIAATKNSDATNYGRLSQIDRNFYGVDLRGTNRGQLLSKPYVLIYGLNVGYQQDTRLDSYQKYDATTGTYTMTDSSYAVVANPSYNRDEIQKANNVDQYVQGTYALNDKLDLHAGVRHSAVSMNINGRSVKTADGSLSFNETIPVIGLVLKATPTLNFYANAGRGFEAPNLIEISFNDTTTPTGANTDLKSSTSTNYEIGTKWLASERTRVNLAAFKTSTTNEIVIEDSGKYTVYTNAGHTYRSGTELSVEHALTSNFNLYVAYSLLDATYGNDVTIKSAPVGGNRIPGTYKTQIYAEASYKYRPLGLSTAVEARYNSKVYVNDANSEFAPSSTVVNLRASLQQISGKWRFTEYARIDNLFDVNYIGSVKLNDNGSATSTALRYFEPAPGRNYIVGVKANYLF